MFEHSLIISTYSSSSPLVRVVFPSSSHSAFPGVVALV